MAWSVGACVVRYVGGILCDLKVDVLVRLLCGVLLPFLAAERLCCAVGLCCSRVKLR